MPKTIIPPIDKGIRNLVSMYEKADDIDRRAGKEVYALYNLMMLEFAKCYNMPIDRVTAAFVSLSPNSDYHGNLRSLKTVLEGVARKKNKDDITVATYNHCRDRAIAYLKGTEMFETKNRGLKILSFYKNILNPADPDYATVDGHIAAAYHGNDKMNMKEAMLSRRDYKTIVTALKVIAYDERLILNQVQSILWFTRKRVLKIKYTPMMDLFNQDDPWRVVIPLNEIKCYN